MRFITVPFCWIDEDKRVLRTDLRINPFSVDAYHPSTLDFEDVETGQDMTQDVTTVYTRSGVAYDLLIHISDFENMYNRFLKQ
jgi:hypothetical protein